MPIWNPRRETMPRVDLEQCQLERLQVTANRAWDGVPFYRRRFEQIGLMPEHLRSLDDLRLLPFTEKAHLRRGYPYDLFAVPLREVVRLHSSSDPSGPTVTGYTKNDLRNWRELAARVLAAGGLTKEDVIQISFGYGLLSDAFGFYQGAEEIGASVIPMSAGAIEQQIGLLRDFRTTALVGTPSHALRLAETLRARDLSISSLHLKWAILGAELWSEPSRRSIESLLGVTASDSYGVAEVIGPGLAGECEQHAGLHVNEDHFLCEIIDPDSGEVLPPGQTGELVVTTLTREALPLLRYRTGDVTSLAFQPCACGRTFTRISRVTGRTDDTFVVSGVRLAPAQIAAVLHQAEGLEDARFQVIVDRAGGVDRMEVRVEVAPHMLAAVAGEVRHLMRAQEALRRQMEAALGVDVSLRLVEPVGLEQTLGEARRVVDRRTPEGGEARG